MKPTAVRDTAHDEESARQSEETAAAIRAAGVEGMAADAEALDAEREYLQQRWEAAS